VVSRCLYALIEIRNVGNPFFLKSSQKQKLSRLHHPLSIAPPTEHQYVTINRLEETICVKRVFISITLLAGTRYFVTRSCTACSYIVNRCGLGLNYVAVGNESCEVFFSKKYFLLFWSCSFWVLNSSLPGLKCPCDIHAKLSVYWKYTNGCPCVYAISKKNAIRVFLTHNYPKYLEWNV